jgi:hypothetical protein
LKGIQLAFLAGRHDTFFTGRHDVFKTGVEIFWIGRQGLLTLAVDKLVAILAPSGINPDKREEITQPLLETVFEGVILIVVVVGLHIVVGLDIVVVVVVIVGETTLVVVVLDVVLVLLDEDYDDYEDEL